MKTHAYNGFHGSRDDSPPASIDCHSINSEGYQCSDIIGNEQNSADLNLVCRTAGRLKTCRVGVEQFHSCNDVITVVSSEKHALTIAAKTGKRASESEMAPTCDCDRMAGSRSRAARTESLLLITCITSD